MRILKTVVSGDSILIAAAKVCNQRQFKPFIGYHTFFEFYIDGDNRAQLLEFNGVKNNSYTITDYKAALKLILSL